MADESTPRMSSISGPRDRLAIRDDRERLELRARQPHRPARDQLLDPRRSSCVLRAELIAARDLLQRDPAIARSRRASSRERLLEPARRRRSGSAGAAAATSPACRTRTRAPRPDAWSLHRRTRPQVADSARRSRGAATSAIVVGGSRPSSASGSAAPRRPSSSASAAASRASERVDRSTIARGLGDVAMWPAAFGEDLLGNGCVCLVLLPDLRLTTYLGPDRLLPIIVGAGDGLLHSRARRSASSRARCRSPRHPVALASDVLAHARPAAAWPSRAAPGTSRPPRGGPRRSRATPSRRNENIELNVNRPSTLEPVGELGDPLADAEPIDQDVVRDLDLRLRASRDRTPRSACAPGTRASGAIASAIDAARRPRPRSRAAAPHVAADNGPLAELVRRFLVLLVLEQPPDQIAARVELVSSSARRARRRLRAARTMATARAT